MHLTNVLRFKGLVVPLLLPMLLGGCVSLATDYRKVGFHEMQKGFAALDKDPQMHEVIHLKNVTVHIVGDRKHFTWERAAAYGSPVQAYATRGNEIYILGAKVGGRIVVNQAILGHELNHLLQFANPRVQNPDRLDDIGA